jgi:hypothetical protein
MLNCRQVTRLVSQSMDGRLSWYQRLGMRFHLLYCVWCRRYKTQIHLLRKASHQLGAEPKDETAEKLSTEARRQIRERMQQAMRDRRQE